MKKITRNIHQVYFAFRILKEQQTNLVTGKIAVSILRKETIAGEREIVKQVGLLTNGVITVYYYIEGIIS